MHPLSQGSPPLVDATIDGLSSSPRRANYSSALGVGVDRPSIGLGSGGLPIGLAMVVRPPCRIPKG